MRITQYDDAYSLRLGAGSTTLGGSSGSNNGTFGGDVVGNSGTLSVIGLRNVVSLASNMGDSTVGTVLTTIQSSPWVAQFATPSNSGGGTPATTVESETAYGITPAVGTDTEYARQDHTHGSPSGTVAIVYVIDGGGSVIATGVAGFLSIPFACTITGARLLADQGGAVVIDVWKDTYANYPPTDADSITASAPPTITATGSKSDDTTLTGWTTSVAAGDVLGFNVDSVTTIERVTLTLTATRA